MPHKNPISSENITGLSRYIRSSFTNSIWNNVYDMKEIYLIVQMKELF